MWIRISQRTYFPDDDDELLLIVMIILLIIFSVFAIWCWGSYKADEHTKQMNCEHEFVQKYEFELFHGEELVTRCWKCGIKEE